MNWLALLPFVKKATHMALQRSISSHSYEKDELWAEIEELKQKNDALESDNYLMSQQGKNSTIAINTLSQANNILRARMSAHRYIELGIFLVLGFALGFALGRF